MEDPVVGHIRTQQLNAVNRLMPAVMFGNMVCAIGVNVMLWHDHAALLLCWLGAQALLSTSRLIGARKFANMEGKRRPSSARAIRRSAFRAAISALVSVGVPSWLLAHSTGSEFAFLLCLETGLFWAGALVLATIAEAALAFSVTAAGLIITGTLCNGLTFGNIFISALILVALAVTTTSARRQTRVLGQSERQQWDLRRQSETIAILLKDYEEQTSDWLWETDHDLLVRQPSKRFSEALGRPGMAIVSKPLATLLTSPGVPGNEAASRSLLTFLEERRPFRELIVPFSQDGEPRWWSFSGRPAFGEGDRFEGFRGVASDVSVSKQAEARLDYLAHHDALTELPNRTSFAAALSPLLENPRARRSAILSLDLDGFKPVNDRFGHPAGDALLVEVAARLRRCLSDGDVLSRFGGDEFILLFVGCTLPVDAEARCANLLEKIAEPFQINDEAVTVGASIGVAFTGTDGQDCEELLRNADAALYRAKRDGRGTTRFYSPDLDRLVLDRHLLVQDLRSALVRRELMLYYQPYVTARDGRVSGCEALLRWKHPTRGLVSPAEFIPLAEESGLIVPIGKWVIEQACRDAREWPSALRVSVNISAAQLRVRELPATILTALAAVGLPPSRLEVEVTETVLIDDPIAAFDVLRQIKAIGVRVALDDFGTGYSSLSYLRSFPFDKIKIDRSFVQQLDTRKDSQIIVRAIRYIAEGLGMTITAEGVETATQAEQLRETGCGELQGFLFSEPQPVDRLRLSVVDCDPNAAPGCNANEINRLALTA